MQINKSRVAIGFIVAGILMGTFGAVFLFVGPAVMNDQIIKVSNDKSYHNHDILLIQCFISLSASVFVFAQKQTNND